MESKLLKLLDALNKPHIKRSLLVIGVIAFLMMSTNILGFIDDYTFSSFSMLDVKGFYDADFFNSMIHQYKSMEQIRPYIILHIEDYVFVLTFYLWLVMVIFTQLKKVNHGIYLILFPSLAMIFDLVENVLIDISLFNEPGIFISTITGYLTLFKFLFLLASVVIIVYQMVISKKEDNHGETQV